MTIRHAGKWPAAFFSSASNSVLRPLALLLSALLACLALASCAGLAGPRQVEVPLAKLQHGLDQRFPVDKRMLDIFNIELSQPQLALYGDSGRVGLTLQVKVAPPFVRQAWHGSLALSGRLILDASRSALQIGELHIDRFTLDGVDPARARQFTEAAGVLADKVLKDVTLYRFHADDLRYAGIQFAPTKIATTAAALVVTFEPVK